MPKRANGFRILLHFLGQRSVPVSLTLSRLDCQPNSRDKWLDSLLRPVFDLSHPDRERILGELIGDQPGCDPATCDQATFQDWLDGLTRSQREEILGQLLFGPWDPGIDRAARDRISNGKPDRAGVQGSPYFEQFYDSQSQDVDRSSAIPSEQNLTYHVLQVLLNCLATHQPRGWPEELWRALVATRPSYARFQKRGSLLEGMERAFHEAVKAVEEANANGGDFPAPDFFEMSWRYLKNEASLRLKTKKRKKRPVQKPQTQILTHTDQASHWAIAESPAIDAAPLVGNASIHLIRKKRDFQQRMNHTHWQPVFAEPDPTSETLIGGDQEFKEWAKELLAELLKDEDYRELVSYQTFLGPSSNKSLWTTDLAMDVLLRNGHGKRIRPDGTVRKKLPQNERARRSRRMKKEEQLFALLAYSRIIAVRNMLREGAATGDHEIEHEIANAIQDHCEGLETIIHDYCTWSKHLDWEALRGGEPTPQGTPSANPRSSSVDRDGLAKQLQMQAEDRNADWQKLKQRLPKTSKNSAFWNVFRQAQVFTHLLVAAFVRVGSQTSPRNKTSPPRLRGFEFLLESCWSVEDSSDQARSWEEFWSDLIGYRL